MILSQGAGRASKRIHRDQILFVIRLKAKSFLVYRGATIHAWESRMAGKKLQILGQRFMGSPLYIR